MDCFSLFWAEESTVIITSSGVKYTYLFFGAYEKLTLNTCYLLPIEFKKNLQL